VSPLRSLLLVTGLLLGLTGGILRSDPPAEQGPNRVEDRAFTLEDCDQLVRLTPEQIRQRLGFPDSRGRQILYSRYLEQWVYERRYMIRVEIDCQRGRKPQVLNVQPLQRGNP
jgi:hypothetical protein